MDGTSETHAPFRDARYAPRALDVERRGDVLILRNPTPYSKTVQTVTAPLVRWASQTPHRVWLAERLARQDLPPESVDNNLAWLRAAVGQASASRSYDAVKAGG